jgi:hypothetical protein
MGFSMECKQCSRQAEPGKKRCAYHLDLRAKQAERRRNKLLEAGTCSCGNKVRNDEKRCGDCAILYAQKLKLKRNNIASKGICPECRNENDTSNYRCSKCAAKRKASAKRLKLEVLNAYGGPKCSCDKCPEKSGNIDFLTIDHINNDGNEHRKVLGSGGSTLYRWLRKNKFPSGYRVLCFNCNSARHINGGICPHEELQAVQADKEL